MRVDFKKTVTKPSPAAPPSLFSGEKASRQAAPQPATRISKLSETTEPVVEEPPQPVIPCTAPLPDPREEDQKYKNPTPQPLIYNPARAGREAYERRRRELSDADLGPSHQMIEEVSKRSNSTRDGSAREKPSLLSRAYNVPIGELRRSQYDEMPIEDFGMAMLMGMGYQRDGSKDVPAVEIKRRVALRAGLGAEKEFELPQEKKARETTEAAQPKAEPCTRTRESPVTVPRAPSHTTDDSFVLAAMGETRKSSSVTHLRDLL